MASIREEITVQRSADEVWDAIADAGAIHERLARASSPTPNWKETHGG